MKSVLISIQPKWCELIASGKKTVEVRKNKPKLEIPFKVYIYCTNTKPYLVWGDVFRGGSWNNEFTHLSGYNRADAEKIWDVFNGKVIGEFVCNEIECFTTDYRADKAQTDRISKQSCVGWYGLSEYEYNSPCLYAWHISDLKIYDKPKELNEFHRPCEDIKNCLNKNFRESGHCLNKCFDCGRRLARPPQSWCYVEGVGEEK